MFVLCFIFLLSCQKEDSNDPITVSVGGLLSLSGNWSSLGLTSQEAMNIAALDINRYLEIKGSRYRFAVSFYDTKLDTALALKLTEEAYKKGVRYMVGPQSSAELAAVLPWANTNKLLLVSQGSTASSLSIPNDAAFRFVPGDLVEGKALPSTLHSSGKRAIITLARDDAGNKGLQQAVGSAFTALGGSVTAVTPYATNLTNYSALLSSLKTNLQQQVAALGADKVAVYLASFDECVGLFKQANTDPVFSSVRWYGGDGVVLSPVITADPQAAAFAAATQFFAPNFGLPLQPHPGLASLETAIKSKTGFDPDAYSFAAYDAMWVIAKTIVSSPTPNTDFEKLKQGFCTEADQYYGITGPLLLNANGDRSTGSFDYWGIVFEGGAYKWKLVGKSL